MSARILVVDSNENFGSFIVHALKQEGYEVHLADGLQNAMGFVHKFPLEMVISEAALADGDGFGLFAKIKELQPQTHCVLLTEVDTDALLGSLHEHGISNAYAKGVPFHTGEFLLRVQQLLSGNIFGIEHYFDCPATRVEWQLRRPEQIEELSGYLMEHCVPPLNPKHIRMVLIEMLTNAMFYGARDERGDQKLDWNREFELTEAEAITLRYFADEEKIGFAISDPGGKLTSHDVLFWLKRQTVLTEEGLPEGVYDNHGRGIFMTRKLMDRLYVNVERGVRSECVLLYFRDRSRIPTNYKPLSIAEI